jgi:hypothetical protein
MASRRIVADRFGLCPQQFIPEVLHHCPTAKMIIVGVIGQQAQNPDSSPVERAAIEDFLRRHGIPADLYAECNPRELFGLEVMQTTCFQLSFSSWLDDMSELFVLFRVCHRWFAQDVKQALLRASYQVAQPPTRRWRRWLKWLRSCRT